MSKRASLPSIAERNGTFYVTWYDPATRRTERQSLRTSDQNEAVARYGAFLAGGNVNLGRSSFLTVKAALEQYDHEHVRVKNADPWRATYAQKYITLAMGDLALSAVDIPRCRKYTADRMSGKVGTPAAASTVRRELTVLRAAASHAVRWKRLTLAEMPTFELPPEARPVEPPWFTKGQMEKIFAAADRDADLGDMVRVLYYTAARRASIETLEGRQINLRTMTVNLAKPTDMMTKKRKPIVPIYPEIAPILRKRLKDGRIFPGRSYYHLFADLCEDMGFPPGHRHPHLLRHSRATHLLQDGWSLFKVGSLLGDTTATVEKTYGHHCPDFLRGGVAPSAEPSSIAELLA